MPWIKAKNGNVFEVEDVDLAKRQIKKFGAEAFVSDPRVKGSKPDKWDGEAQAESAETGE